MPPVERWNTVATRMYNLGRAAKWKWSTIGPALKAAGYTELSVPHMSAADCKYITTALTRGYVLKDGPERELLKMVVASAPKPIGIGYIGRTKISVYFPNTVDCSPIVKELHTMQSLLDAKQKMPYIAKPMANAEVSISARLYVHRARGEGPPPAHFTEARHLLDHHLQATEAWMHRKPVLDWFETKPVIRVPFTSHTREGAWRTKDE